MGGFDQSVSCVSCFSQAGAHTWQAYVLANFAYHTLSHWSGYGTLGNQVMEIVKVGN